MFKVVMVASALALMSVSANAQSFSASHSTQVDFDNVKGVHSTSVDAALSGGNINVGADDAAGVKIANKKATTSTSIKASVPAAAVAGFLD
jgi:hypothetical protein